ncbi:MAG: type II secretion system F family protein [Clostridia bacterium]|nr:type II secretion system F family protein [Clostridia bacterium]
MATFTYEAVNDLGEIIKSTYEAEAKNDVLAMLENKQLYPIKVEETIGKEIKAPISLQRVKLKDIAFFCRQVSALLDAGIPIADALQIIKQQIANKRLQKAVEEVSEEVQTGMSFSEAMKKQEVFPVLFIHMVAAGEVSGTLDFVMRRMAEDYEKEYKMQKKVSGSMVYPILIIIVAIVAVIFIVTSVLPRFTEMFTDVGLELPAATQLMIKMSDFLQQYWLYLFIALGLVIYGLIRFIKTTQGRLWLDYFKLGTPIIGAVNNKVVTARFTRTLASLLKSGIPLMQAMEYVAAIVGNVIVEEKLLQVREEISKGANLTESVRKADIFDPVVIHMVKTGEDSGKLDEVMENTAIIYDQEVEVAVQGITSVIEPVMIILMAAVVGFIVFSIITPMFDIAQTVGM